MGTAPVRGRALPLRSRARTRAQSGAAANAGASETERAAQAERRRWVAQQRRNRRLLEWGAALFPTERLGTHALPLGGAASTQHTTESDIERVMLQSVSEAQAPHVAVDRDLSRTSPSVRRLLSQRRGANALLDEAASLGQLAHIPSFTLGPPTCRSRRLCDVCGYWGDVTCMACGDAICSRTCQQTHLETRCERGV